MDLCRSVSSRHAQCEQATSDLRPHHPLGNCCERIGKRISQSQYSRPRLWLRDEGRSPGACAVCCRRGGRGQQTHAKTKQKSLDECVGSKALGSSGDPRTHLVVQRVLVYLHRAALPPPGKSIADGFHVEPNGLVPRYDVLEHLELVETDRVTLGDAASYGCTECRRETRAGTR